MRALIYAAVSSAQQAADDKHSLQAQVEGAKAWCIENDHVIVDTLEAIHSRDYVDFHECAADMRASGQDAFDRLNQHWIARDFDVLIVAYGSRLGRTASLHSYIVERTIKELGLSIYVVAEHTLYDRDNFRFWNTLSSFHAAAENDERVRRRRQTIDAMILSGVPLPINRPLWTHRIVRDPNTGERLYPVPKDEARPVFDALAVLLLDGVSYAHLGAQLYQRFGILDTFPDTRHFRVPRPQTPKPFAVAKLFRALANPAFWGHTAKNWHGETETHKQITVTGLWALDNRYPHPPGVLISYDTHEPMYAGELAERVKAEIIRRSTSMKGRARPRGSNPFTGLFVCHECGYRMAGVRAGQFMRCDSSYTRKDLVKCSQETYIPRRRITALFDRLIEMLLAGDESVFEVTPDGVPTPTPITILDAQINALDVQINRLIDLTQHTNQDVSQIGQRLSHLSEARSKAVQERAVLVANQQDADKERAQRKLALSDLQHIQKVFWQQSPTTINQFLHRIMGDYRISVEHGQCVGLARSVPAMLTMEKRPERCRGGVKTIRI